MSYRMARRATLASARAGTTARSDICDAHPELVRAAVHHGDPVNEPCPVCEGQLFHVGYVFGPRLPGHGRCVTTSAELERFARRKGDFTHYVVEVCPACRWHHLDRAELI